MTYAQSIRAASLDRHPNSKVAALVITYFPDAEVSERLGKLLEQVERVAIVDNGSDAASLAVLEPLVTAGRITIQRNAANLGIATALNQGMISLAEEGYQWVLTLDQDSTVTTGLVEALLATLRRDPAPQKIAIVGSNRVDPKAPEATHRWLRPKRGLPFFEKVSWDKLDADGTTIAITSGSLTNTTIFRELGGFRGEMFIDMVDMEYCLRARRFGYRTIIGGEAELIHRVGETRTVSLLGLRISPTHHSPVRRYYLFRNSIALMKEQGAAFPHWLIYHLVAMVHILIGIVFVEPRKTAQLRACVIGIWDGVCGRTGPAGHRF